MGSSNSKAFVCDPAHFAAPLDGSATMDASRQYDYIIIGGGTAGCVLASRLSGDAAVTVLLVEAGKSHDADLMTRIPLAISKTFKTATDWDFETTSQPALNDRQIYWPRGKILGGTSAINALIYHHCAPEDFDEWEKLGAEGWNYNAMRPYFRKAESYTSSALFPNIDANNRGTKGPWFTGHCNEFAPINGAILNACKALGIPYNPDLNTSKGTMGVTDFVGIVDSKGQRSSTATAYLTTDVLSRPNLTVAVSVMTEKILFDNSGSEPRAIGVELSTSPTSTRYCARATREVILCAGAVGSPQLLMLSGVGPAQELQELGIPLVKDLSAVGKNLSDHISSGPLVFRATPGITWDYLTKPLPGAIALIKWLMFGRGPMATLPCTSGAFVRSDDTHLPLRAKDPSKRDDEVKDLSSGATAPDIELVWFPLIALEGGFRQPPPGTVGITVAAIALKPESVGAITLKTKSIWDKPLIDGRYFKSESDLNVVLRGTRLCLNIARTEPLRSLLDLRPGMVDKHEFFWPGDADPDKITDAELKAWIRGNAAPAYHPASSCRMGVDTLNSVVDSKLRVHGITALRVVDASVFPTQVSGHPCAVVVAIAEKIADHIKNGL